jgi:hypothetical protein
LLRVALKTKFKKQVVNSALGATLLMPGAGTIGEILGAFCLLRQAPHCWRQSRGLYIQLVFSEFFQGNFRVFAVN